MVRKIVMAMLLVIGTVTVVAAAETVTFKSISKKAFGKTLMLTGKLTKPKGDGPIPAVVLLHGCRGITPSYDAWVKRLVEWGYVALQVDSFGPRGVSNDCGRPFHISRKTRVQDAYAAKSYLAGLQFVDHNRIAVMGWSYGGVTTLFAVSTTIGAPKEDPFRAGMAFYPGCHREVASPNAPLLILIGERDDWTPPARCKTMRKIWLKKKSAHELVLKIYPGAYHGFDVEGLDEKYRGHQMQYDPMAATDAVVQVKNFLAKHMK